MFNVRWFVVLLCVVLLGRNVRYSTSYRINVRSKLPTSCKRLTLLNNHNKAIRGNSHSIRSTVVMAETSNLLGESFMDTIVIGLNSMKDKNSNDSDVVAHLSTFVSHFKTFSGSLSSAQISATLYGLQGMKSDCLEVSKLLSALSNAMIVDTGTFNAKEIGYALYGLRCMSTDSPELLELLSVLGPRIERSTCTLDSVSLGMAFDGLQGKRGCSKVSSIIDFLYCQLESLVMSTDQLKELSCDNLILLGNQLALTEQELIEAFNDEHPKWEEINLIIADEIARRFSSNEFVLLDKESSEDNLVFMRSSESQYITLSSRFNLLGAYDCRVRPNTADSEEPVLSGTAVRDGGVASVRFCMSRDRHLSSNLNSIEGVGAKHLRTVDTLEFKQWLSSRVGITYQ